MTWTDEELVRQFRGATYAEGSPLTPKVRARVAVKAVLEANVWRPWRRWADGYLARGANAEDAAYNAAANLYAGADAATYAARAAALFFDAASAAADAIRPLNVDDATLARYIRAALDAQQPPE